MATALKVLRFNSKRLNTRLGGRELEKEGQAVDVADHKRRQAVWQFLETLYTAMGLPDFKDGRPAPGDIKWQG